MFKHQRLIKIVLLIYTLFCVSLTPLFQTNIIALDITSEDESQLLLEDENTSDLEEEDQEEEDQEDSEVDPENTETEEELNDDIIDETINEAPNDYSGEIVPLTIAPHYMTLGPNEYLITTFSDLSQILASSAPEVTIYLANDIEINIKGIQINNAKKSIKINGINPNDPYRTVHSLIEYKSSGISTTIRANAGSLLKKVEFSDLKITGYNPYGTVYIPDFLSGVSFVYNRVNYYGPQALYNRNGSVQFIDSEMLIDNYFSNAQEVAEVGDIRFTGIVKIFHLKSSSAIFLFTKNSSITVDESAFVYIISEKASTVFRGMTINIMINPKATLIASVCYTFSESMINAFNVYVDATFKLDLSEATTANVMNIKSALEINDRSVFQVKSAKGAKSIVNLESGGSLHVLDPKSFYLYNLGKRTIMSTTSKADIFFIGQQINYWKQNVDLGPANQADYHWAKQDQNTLFFIHGSLNPGLTGNFISVFHNFENNDWGETPTIDNFNLNNARIISVGTYKPIFSEVSQNKRTLFGATGANAWQRVIYFDADGVVMRNVQSDNTGSLVYTLPTIPNSDYLYVVSSWNYLSYSYSTWVFSDGELKFASVPSELKLNTTSLSSNTEYITRSNDEWNLTIKDTRGSGNHWKLYARLKGDLKPKDASRPALKGALIFKDSNNQDQILSPNQNVLIHQEKNSGNGNVVIQWQPNQGILGQVLPGTAYVNTEYSATIQWILADVP